MEVDLHNPLLTIILFSRSSVIRTPDWLTTNGQIATDGRDDDKLSTLTAVFYSYPKGRCLPPPVQEKPRYSLALGSLRFPAVLKFIRLDDDHHG